MAVVHELIYLYIWVLFLTALLSWVPTHSSDGFVAGLKRLLARLTEPVLRPLRAVLPRPRLGGVGVDVSVLVAMVALEIINVLL
ncbi:MAG TPA: YggT family protein [Acidimicrobiales bacterium]|nr:YggT family protein [Acidimicrobiales bacterium]